MFNRRRFLALSLLSPWAFPPQILTAAQDRPRISFGFSLYGMRPLTVPEGLEACARIGYDAVELATLTGYPGEPSRLSREDRQRIRQTLTKLNLSLPAMLDNLPLAGTDANHRQNLERLQADMELGRDLVPDSPPLVETILGGRPGEWDKLRTPLATRLADYARLGEKYQTIVCIKPHRLQAMNLPEQALWLLDQVKSPWIKLAYDYSHYEHRNLALADTLKTLLPVTRFIHVKDVRLEGDRVNFLLPGETNFDYAGYFRQLREMNYVGCVCVEVSAQLQNQAGYDGVAAARRSYQNLAPAFARAGITVRQPSK